MIKDRVVMLYLIRLYRQIAFINRIWIVMSIQWYRQLTNLTNQNGIVLDHNWFSGILK